MTTFTVQQGKRYRTEISLGLFERFASNATIEERLREAGFSEVQVSGSGSTRSAEALWPGPDATATIPSQVTSVTEIVSA
jgi:hypothetical protein